MAEPSGKNSTSTLELSNYIALSPLVPASIVAFCSASFLLSSVFHLQQFGLFATFTEWIFQIAAANSWEMAGLVACLLAPLPLASFAAMEEPPRPVDVAGYWILGDLFAVASAWLACIWPYSGSGFQLIVFATLLSVVCVSVCKCALTMVRLVMIGAA
jgi:hypothetical protein